MLAVVSQHRIYVFYCAGVKSGESDRPVMRKLIIKREKIVFQLFIKQNRMPVYTVSKDNGQATFAVVHPMFGGNGFLTYAVILVVYKIRILINHNMIPDISHQHFNLILFPFTIL